MTRTLLICLLSMNCLAQLTPNTTPKYLDKNYVRARIHTDNDKFWNVTGNPAPWYEVPAGSGTHVIYGNSLWIGGIDAGSQLRTAANTYKQNGLDFWPGPLDTSNIGAFNAANSTPYNRLWKIDCDDITAFVNAFNNGSVTAGTYTVPNDIVTYPAIGTNNFKRAMEPFMDVNGDGLYQPLVNGDYPIIKGQQQILSIYNDRNGVHTESSGNPLGIEIHERSYAYFDPNLPDSMQAVNYSTFYHYTIYHRGSFSYNNVYITDWSDTGLGNYTNDFAGTDSANNFVYCYNSTATDPSLVGLPGYGNKPPVLSHAILKTDCSSDGIDNNNNGTIDEAGERFMLNKTTYYNNNTPNFPVQTTNPATPIEYYNYMSGFWKDNSSFSYGGTAYGGTVNTSFIYTGDPSTNTGWTEGNAGNTAGNRRILLSSGPFNLLHGSKLEWGYAIIFSQDTSQAVNTITQFNSRVKRDVRNVLYYDQMQQTPVCAPSIAIGIKKQAEKRLSVIIYPNPVADVLTVDLSENVKEAAVDIMDLSGRILMTSKINAGYRGRLNISHLDKGIYLVKISSGNKTALEKIIRN